jgi:hypothetical protein
VALAGYMATMDSLRVRPGLGWVVGFHGPGMNTRL